MPTADYKIPFNDIAIIIAAYNPPEALYTVCDALVKKNWAIFLVNDGSSNNSAFKLIADMPVIQIQHKINLGQGAALETGIQKAIDAEKKIFITFDADGQHDTEAVCTLVQQLIQSQSDIVFGSRFITKEAALQVPPTKRVTLKLAAKFERLMTGINLSDSHNGLRAFTREVAKNIHFTENRMAHATEILWLTKKYKWKYTECPVTIQYGNTSQHPLRSIEILFDIFLRKIIS